MREHLAKLPPRIRMLLAIPLLMMAYPVIMILIPAMIWALMPDVVRSVLRLI